VIKREVANKTLDKMVSFTDFQEAKLKRGDMLNRNEIDDFIHAAGLIVWKAKDLKAREEARPSMQHIIAECEKFAFDTFGIKLALSVINKPKGRVSAFTPEEQLDVITAPGKVFDKCKKIGISIPTYYTWKHKLS
jgi:hypothetical protein